MTLADFSEHIPKNILNRGREYEENGQVTVLSEKSNTTHTLYRAVVKGTKRYTVQVQVDKSTGEIEFYDCTCPFDGEVCKHVAAVLFAVMESSDEDIEDAPLRQKKNTTEQLLGGLSEAELKQYLRSLMEENREVKKHFTATFIMKAASDKNDYKAILTQSVKGLRGAASFTNPDSVYKAMVPVHRLLEHAEKSLHDGSHEQVLQIAQAVLEKLVPSLQYIDDSNGWMGDCIREAVHLLYLLADVTEDKSLRKKMFQWFLKSAPGKQFLDWDCAWDFAILAAITASPSMEEQIVAMTTAMMELIEDGTSWSKDFNAGRAAEVMLTFYENHKSEKDVEAFIEQNLDLSNIREMAVTQFTKRKNFKRAIELCREGIAISTRKKFPGEVNKWYEMLLEIFRQQDNKSGIIECAEFLFRNSHLELTYYNMLKKELGDEQWKARQSDFLKLYQQRHKWYELAVIYAEEERKQDLMNTLRMSRHVPLIKEFQNHLMPAFKKELHQLYFEIVSGILEQYADRSHYREAANIIKNMKANFNVADIQLFVIEIRERYKHRRALLDEFKSI